MPHPFKVGQRVLAPVNRDRPSQRSPGKIDFVESQSYSGKLVASVAFDNGDYQWPPRDTITILESDHAPRIRACIEKYRARMPKFDRATWRPKVGEKVVTIEDNYLGAKGKIKYLIEDDGSDTPYFGDDPSEPHDCCITLTNLEPA